MGTSRLLCLSEARTLQTQIVAILLNNGFLVVVRGGEALRFLSIAGQFEFQFIISTVSLLVSLTC